MERWEQLVNEEMAGVPAYGDAHDMDPQVNQEDAFDAVERARCQACERARARFSAEYPEPVASGDGGALLGAPLEVEQAEAPSGPGNNENHPAPFDNMPRRIMQAPAGANHAEASLPQDHDVIGRDRGGDLAED